MITYTVTSDLPFKGRIHFGDAVSMTLGDNQQRFPCEDAAHGSNPFFFVIVARPVVYAHATQGDEQVR